MNISDKPLTGETGYGTSDDTYRKVPSDTVDLREVLAKFWVRKKLILTSTLICAGLAFAIAKLITPTYIGEAFLMVEPLQSSGPAGNVGIMAGIDDGSEVVQTQAFVLRSRALASETIERLHLDRDPEFNPSLRKPNPLLALLEPATVLFDRVRSRLQPITALLSGAGNAPEAGGEIVAAAVADQAASRGEPSTAMVDAFMKQLHVTAQDRSAVIQVSFNSSHPTTAGLVPNTLIQLYLAQRISEKDKVLARESERLDKVVLPMLREKMQTSERALAEYRQKSGLVSDQNPTALGEELSETEAQLAVARAHTEQAAVRLGQFQSASTTAAPDEPPSLQYLREQEVGLQAQLAALRGSFGANYPKTVELEAKLKKLNDAMRRESAGVVGSLKAELTAAQAAEAELDKQVTELTHRFAEANGGDTRLQRLIGKADADRKTYERYLARANEVDSNLGRAQPDARLVSRADVPLNPSSPNTRMLVMVGIGLGAGIGTILAAMLDTLLGGLRNKEQAEECLGIKCLGLVPRIKQSRRHQSPAPSLEPQNTAFGQAIRNVELKLLSFNGRNDSRVVLVTAALANEGKTWVAVSLASCFAADGFSVAIVDCDLHRPNVHRTFDGTRGPGLTDYFAGDVALDQIAHYHRGSGVTYIPAGTALSKEARRLTSDRLRPLIERLVQKYAFVILDSAPVLAASETILLSQVAQKAILVVKWASTSPAVARHAAVQLMEGGGADTAVLLSMVDVRRAAKYGDPIARAYQQLGNYYGR